MPALNMLFMLPVSHPIAWVSGYLPGNSLLRAGVGLVADPALTGPLLTGFAVLALWGCARRLWPDDRETATVSLLLFVASGQVLMMGMTAYAMPAHLCFNLVWLWLFLGDRRRLDVAALALGFVATGLHQPLFHPMFVAPWLLVALTNRRWSRVALFTLGYAAIGLFWLAWPHVTLGLITGPHSTSEAGSGYLARLLDVLSSNQQNLPMMACNLLRFCTWQTLALLPLLIAGFASIRRNPQAMALATGFALPIVVMVLILPYQGHGFGYRYVHGVMGNAVLLAGYGWQRLRQFYPQLPALFVRSLALGALVLMPLEAWFAYQLYTPFAHASARITASRADYAIIGAEDGPYALDLVLNRPDLSNRPIRLSAGDIADVDVLARRICQKGAVMALPTDAFFAEINAEFGAPSSGKADARIKEQTALFEAAGCRVIPLG